jgi:hypothetical protein
MVWSHPQQIVHKTLSQKRAGRVAQGVGPEFKPQYRKKRRKQIQVENMRFWGLRGGTEVWTQGLVDCKAGTLPLEPHTSSPFPSGYFRDRVSWTICPGWLRTLILLISDSQVARITGVSPWHLAKSMIFLINSARVPKSIHKKWALSQSQQ